MDYELLHEVSLIDKEIQRTERKKIDKDTIKELNALKNKHKHLKESYEKELGNQSDLSKKTRAITRLIDDKTKEKIEHETNLYSTNNLKTIEICQKIVDNLNFEIKGLEDEIYTLINQNESITEENLKQVNEVNDIRDSYNKILGKYKKNQDALNKEISILSSKRNNLINNVSAPAKKIYDDIKMERGFGMSEVKGEICSGCNVGVPLVIIEEVKYTKKLIKCPNCSRLLYISEP
jgi:predicted  nucleic acid-binding Zn-ribbon protein